MSQGGGKARGRRAVGQQGWLRKAKWLLLLLLLLLLWLLQQQLLLMPCGWADGHCVQAEATGELRGADCRSSSPISCNRRSRNRDGGRSRA